MDPLFLEYCKKNSPRFMTAFKGNLSEYHMFNFLSAQPGFKVECSPDDGGADFKVWCAEKSYSIEHKRARNTKYANGDLKVELQKSRDSGVSKKNRYYLASQFDIVTVDISEHTGKQDDFRFAKTNDLTRDAVYTDCLKKMQRIGIDDHSTWKTNLYEAIGEESDNDVDKA